MPDLQKLRVMVSVSIMRNFVPYTLFLLSSMLLLSHWTSRSCTASFKVLKKELAWRSAPRGASLSLMSDLTNAAKDCVTEASSGKPHGAVLSNSCWSESEPSYTIFSSSGRLFNIACSFGGNLDWKVIVLSDIFTDINICVEHRQTPSIKHQPLPTFQCSNRTGFLDHRNAWPGPTDSFNGDCW